MIKLWSNDAVNCRDYIRGLLGRGKGREVRKKKWAQAVWGEGRWGSEAGKVKPGVARRLLLIGSSRPRRIVMGSSRPIPMRASTQRLAWRGAVGRMRSCHTGARRREGGVHSGWGGGVEGGFWGGAAPVAPVALAANRLRFAGPIGWGAETGKLRQEGAGWGKRGAVSVSQA